MGGYVFYDFPISFVYLSILFSVYVWHFGRYLDFGILSGRES